MTTAPCVQCDAPVEVDLDQFSEKWRDRYLQILRCDGCVSANRAESDAEEAERLAGKQARLVEKRRVLSGVPRHLWSWSFDEIVSGVTPDGIAAARAWATGDLNGLMIVGATGRGKTRLAVAAANALMDRREVRFVSVARMSLVFAGGSFERRDELIELLGDPGMAIVLDDVDKVRRNEVDLGALYTALSDRADGSAPVLATSNVRLGQLGFPAPFGDPLVSRLSLLTQVEVRGDDLRLRA